jgi:hypothetical protein
MTASSTSSSVSGAEMTSEGLLLVLYCRFLTTHSRHVLTGSYHNYFRIYNTDTLNDVVLQADKSAFKVKKGAATPGKGNLGVKNGRPLREAMTMETLDFNKKILHASWHPRENTIAVSENRHQAMRLLM